MQIQLSPDAGAGSGTPAATPAPIPVEAATAKVVEALSSERSGYDARSLNGLVRATGLPHESAALAIVRLLEKDEIESFRGRPRNGISKLFFRLA